MKIQVSSLPNHGLDILLNAEIPWVADMIREAFSDEAPNFHSFLILLGLALSFLRV